MVSAGSLNRFSGKENIFKITVTLIAFVIVIAITLALFFSFGKSSDDGVARATSTSLPAELAESVLGVSFRVSQPAKLPKEFVRTDVSIISETRTKSGCSEVLQNFQGSSDPNVAYIDLYSTPSGCSYPRPDDAQVFNVGDYSGWISDPDATQIVDDDSMSLLIELTVAEAIVRIETDLTREQITPVIELFEPFKLEPPAATLTISVS